MAKEKAKAESKESDAAKQRRTQPQGENKKRKDGRKEGKKGEKEKEKEKEEEEKKRKEGKGKGKKQGKLAPWGWVRCSSAAPLNLKLEPTQANPSQPKPFLSFPYPLSIARNIFTASATLATFFTCSRRRPRTSFSSQRRRFAVA